MKTNEKWQMTGEKNAELYNWCVCKFLNQFLYKKKTIFPCNIFYYKTENLK